MGCEGLEPPIQLLGYENVATAEVKVVQETASKVPSFTLNS